jgi:hypothetical protein
VADSPLTGRTRPDRWVRHVFKPGKFSGRCQVMLACYRCPYDEELHVLDVDRG